MCVCESGCVSFCVYGRVGVGVGKEKREVEKEGGRRSFVLRWHDEKISSLSSPVLSSPVLRLEGVEGGRREKKALLL